MAKVQIDIPDKEIALFTERARQEGVSLSAWLSAAAYDRLSKRYCPQSEGENDKAFKSVEELEAFFRRCDEVTEAEGPEREPDWEEHKKVIHEGKMSVWTGK